MAEITTHDDELWDDGLTGYYARFIGGPLDGADEMDHRHDPHREQYVYRDVSCADGRWRLFCWKELPQHAAIAEGLYRMRAEIAGDEDAAGLSVARAAFAQAYFGVPKAELRGLITDQLTTYQISLLREAAELLLEASDA